MFFENLFSLGFINSDILLGVRNRPLTIKKINRKSLFWFSRSFSPEPCEMSLLMKHYQKIEKTVRVSKQPNFESWSPISVSIYMFLLRKNYFDMSFCDWGTPIMCSTFHLSYSSSSQILKTISSKWKSHLQFSLK